MHERYQVVKNPDTGWWSFAHGTTFPDTTNPGFIPSLWQTFRRDDTGETYEWNGTAWVLDTTGGGAGGADIVAQYLALVALGA